MRGMTMVSVGLLAGLVACGPEAGGPLAAELAIELNRSASNCTNVRGQVEAAFVDPPGPGAAVAGLIHDEALGTGDASATIVAVAPAGSGALFVELVHEYTWENVGSLLTEDEGVLAPIDPAGALYRFENRLEVVGGTGALEGASGFIRAHGTAVLAQGGEIELSYHGRVCT